MSNPAHCRSPDGKKKEPETIALAMHWMLGQQSSKQIWDAMNEVFGCEHAEHGVAEEWGVDRCVYLLFAQSYVPEIIGSLGTELAKSRRASHGA